MVANTAPAAATAARAAAAVGRRGGSGSYQDARSVKGDAAGRRRIK